METGSEASDKPLSHEAEQDACILLRGLTRRFGDLVAVDSLDLAVPYGSFFGFLGPNGAGKSTTISMLTGLLAPHAGEGKILGLDLKQETLEIKKQIGVVPEQLALFERLSGREYLELVGRLYGLGRREVARRAGDLLEFMQLRPAAEQLILEYSQGMKKKLALSAALIHRPRILFLDEPFEGIDAIASRAIRDVLKKLVQGGMTIFLTSHVLEIVERLCDRVAIIHQGRLLASGTLEQLHAGVQLPATRTEGQKQTLEELFLHLLGRSEPPGPSLPWLLEGESEQGK